MSKANDDNKPDLIEAVDMLLEEIDETTQTFVQAQEKAVDPNARITDDGAVDAEPEDPIEVAKEGLGEELSEVDELVDSIETAQQALDAIDEVESRAEDLIAQSVDALLEDTETAADPDGDTPADESSIEQDAEDESEAKEEIAAIDELLSDEDEEINTQELMASIDDLLTASAEQDAQIDETLAEAIEESVEEEVLEEEAAEEDADGDDPSGEADEAAAAAVAPEPEPEPEPELDESDLITETHNPTSSTLDNSMDMLDSALAEAADDMLDGDYENEEGELVSGEAMASAIEDALESTQSDETPTDAPESGAEDQSEAASAAETGVGTIKTLVPEPDTEPSTDAEAQQEIEALEEIHAKEPITVPAWFERGIEIIRPKIDRFDPLKGKTMDAVAMVLGSAIVAVMTHATPMSARAMILLSKPLSKQPPEIRNAVGFIALWTGFLAAVVWIYLLMFRTPTIPTPEVAPTRVISADESMTAPVVDPIEP